MHVRDKESDRQKLKQLGYCTNCYRHKAMSGYVICSICDAVADEQRVAADEWYEAYKEEIEEEPTE